MEEVSISFEKNKWRGADCLSMCAVKWRAEEERKENKNIQNQNNLQWAYNRARRQSDTKTWLKVGNKSR